jgi:hypothetical protein
MRRKRTSVTSPDRDDATSQSVGTNNSHSVTSPRSPGSHGTFDSVDVNSPFGNGSTAVSGSLSNVGSLIGHDDPTLVHTNIIKSPGSGAAGGIRSSETIDSFLTDYNSDFAVTESRESPTKHSQKIPDHELREQLSELDRAQAQWQERQKMQQTHTGIKDMDSTGDFYVSEAGGHFRSISNPRRSMSLSLYEQTILEEESGDEIVEDSSRDQRLFDYDNEDEYDNNSNSNNEEADDNSDEDDDEKKDRDISNIVGVVGRASTDSASVASNIASSVGTNAVESATSDLVFEYPSTDNSSEHIVAKTKVVGLMLPSKDEKDQSVDGFAQLRSIEGAEAPAETDEIVKQVQKRLYDLSFNATSTSSPLGKERIEPPSDQRKAGFRSWIPVGDGTTAKSTARGGLASQSDLFAGDDDFEDYVPRRRRRKLCCLNFCLLLLIVAAIICSVLFAVDMIGSDSNASVIAPTAPPTQSTENPSPTTANTPTVQLPSSSPAGGIPPTSEIPTTSSPTETLPNPMPTTLPNPVDDRLVAISGDAINEPGTPQYIAYDWLVNNDTASLDLETVSDLDLEQRYIAAVFYFSLGGVNWLDQLGFLEDSNVCEWNNNSTRSVSGIICENNTGVIKGFAISKFLCLRLFCCCSFLMCH